MKQLSGIVSIGGIVLFICFSYSSFAQADDSLSIIRQKNRLRVDTVNINLKNISTQLITLRDSLGVEIMAMDKRVINLQPTARLNLEKSKCKLSVYKAELEKLIEEVTMADITYITEVKKRAYQTVLDVRADFIHIIGETKILN